VRSGLLGRDLEPRDDAGVRLVGHVLGPPADTPTTRVPGGETRVDEGPVTDENAHIAGFDISERADLDGALEVASRNPGAGFGIPELRPIEE